MSDRDLDLILARIAFDAPSHEDRLMGTYAAKSASYFARKLAERDETVKALVAELRAARAGERTADLHAHGIVE